MNLREVISYFVDLRSLFRLCFRVIPLTAGTFTWLWLGHEETAISSGATLA